MSGDPPIVEIKGISDPYEKPTAERMTAAEVLKLARLDLEKASGHLRDLETVRETLAARIAAMGCSLAGITETLHQAEALARIAAGALRRQTELFIDDPGTEQLPDLVLEPPEPEVDDGIYPCGNCEKPLPSFQKEGLCAECEQDPEAVEWYSRQKDR